MVSINWRALWTKLSPSVPWFTLALAVSGWCATHTYKQRELGASHAETKQADAAIAVLADTTKFYRARADRADHAVDSIAALLVGARAKAKASDSVSTVLTLSYRDLRDRTLNPVVGSIVPAPTLPEVFASADAAVNACELAKADCKARGDLEQARGDSARAAAAARTREANAAIAARDSAQQNEKRAKALQPSAIGSTARAAWWASIGAGVVYVACRFLVHCQ